MHAHRRPFPASLAALWLTLSLVAAPASPAAGQEPEPPPAGEPALVEPAPPVDPVEPPPEQMPPVVEEPPPAEGAPATPPVPPADTVPGAGPGRTEFVLNFPEEEGGGTAAGSAETIDYLRDTYAQLGGGVRLRYQDIELQAAAAEVDLITKVVTARGDVVLDQGPRRLTGETLEFDLDTKTGKLTNATAHVAPDYYFSGTEVAKVDEDVYTVQDGIFTSCSQEVPDWSFRLGEARVELEGYARVRNASLRVKKLPIFYTPYILWPAKSERTSGLLVPQIGYSERRGASVQLAYFQTLGRSYDTTFHVDTFSEGFLGLGNELRYRPTEGTQGNLILYSVKDPEGFEEDEWRWKAEWNHVTNDLPWGLRGVVRFQDFSDFNFFRDFERDFDRNTLRFIDSRAFVSGSWGPHLFNFLVQDRETFVGGGQTVEQRKLPEVEYRLRSTRLGRTPLYLQMESSLAYLDVSRPGGVAGSYGRADLFPQLTLPIRTFPWLSLSVTAGERLTFYENTVDPATGAFAGETLTRALPYAAAQVIGPSFSRIFNTEIGGFAKLKHVIEPRWSYTYRGDFEEIAEVPLFDEVDFVRSTNSGRFALVNRVLAKPEGAASSAREVFLFELAQAVSFDDEQPLQISRDRTITSEEGPLEALMRFNPTNRVTLKAEARYSTLFSGLDSTELSGNLGFGGGTRANVSWFTRYDAESGGTLANQLRIGGSVTILPQKLALEGQVNYDLEENFLQQQRYVLTWNAQCYGLRLELRDFRTGAGVNQRVEDREFRFALSLKNVGTFLDLTSRSSTLEP